MVCNNGKLILSFGRVWILFISVIINDLVNMNHSPRIWGSAFFFFFLVPPQSPETPLIELNLIKVLDRGKSVLAGIQFPRSNPKSLIKGTYYLPRCHIDWGCIFIYGWVQCRYYFSLLLIFLKKISRKKFKNNLTMTCHNFQKELKLEH